MDEALRAALRAVASEPSEAARLALVRALRRALPERAKARREHERQDLKTRALIVQDRVALPRNRDDIRHISHRHGRWRGPAVVYVREALEVSKLAGDDEGQRAELLRHVYPHGRREYWPYKVWRDEVRRQLGKPRAGRAATFDPRHPLRGRPHDERTLPLFGERSIAPSLGIEDEDRDEEEDAAC